MHRHGGSGICEKACGAWRDSVQNHEGRFARELRDFGGRTDRSQIKDAGTARDQDQVSGLCSGQGCTLRVWRRIDECEGRSAFLRGLKRLREPGGGYRHYDRAFRLARILPARSTCLRIKINHDRCPPGFLGGDG
jgi:hypothetical protein